MSSQIKNKRQVWVWTEQYQGKLTTVSLGLLGKAQELCQQLGGGEVAAVLVGADSTQLVTKLIEHGSDKVFLADDSSLTIFETELCAHLMTRLVQIHQPDIVLWGATSLGRETASRVATRLGTGLTAHCIDLYIEEIKEKRQLVTVVAGWGGNLTLKIICPKKRPQMATVKPGIFPPSEPNQRIGEVIPVKVEDRAARLDIVEVVVEEDETATLEQADVVVVGGWGLDSPGGFQALTEIAQMLNGSVAGTRPALDAGWISAENMIGQSGRTIAPRLLVTLGISGAAQFSTGVLDSKFILAVDKNPNAPIFEMADIGIVGDLQEILPLLTSKLRAIKGKSG